MEFASDGKEKNKPQESEGKYWENETEKNKPHKICHIEKIYWTLGNTIESDVFKIYDRDDDRGPRNRDPKNPTATDREPRPRDRDRDRDTTSAFTLMMSFGFLNVIFGERGFEMHTYKPPKCMWTNNDARHTPTYLHLRQISASCKVF